MAATRTPSNPETALSALDIQSLIDEFGEADRQFKLFVPQVNPHAARRALALMELQRRYADLAADQQKIEDGRAYQLVVTQRELQHPITLAVKKNAWRALKRLKKDPLDIFGTTLGQLKQELGKAFVTKHVPEVRGGSRDFVVTALAKAKEQKAA
jgi:hypothetical protein